MNKMIKNIENFVFKDIGIKISFNTKERNKLIKLQQDFNVDDETFIYLYKAVANEFNIKSINIACVYIRNSLIDGVNTIDKVNEMIKKNQENNRNKFKKSYSNNTINTEKKDRLKHKYLDDDSMSDEERKVFVDKKLKQKIPIPQK